MLQQQRKTKSNLTRFALPNEKLWKPGILNKSQHAQHSNSYAESLFRHVSLNRSMVTQEQTPTKNEIYFAISEKPVQWKSFLPFQLMSLQRCEARSINKFPFPVHFLTKTWNSPLYINPTFNDVSQCDSLLDSTRSQTHSCIKWAAFGINIKTSHCLYESLNLNTYLPGWYTGKFDTVFKLIPRRKERILWISTTSWGRIKDGGVAPRVHNL